MGKAEYHDLESITLVNCIQALRRMGPLSQAATKAVLYSPTEEVQGNKVTENFQT